MRIGVIVLATALVLGACTSDPAPAEPEPTASTTQATPTRAVPTMPDQASEDSAEGAAAFVHHYVDVFNYAAATGDVEELTRLSSPDCNGCQRYIDLYRDTYEAGGYFKGGDWELGELQVQRGDPESFVTALAKTEPGPYRDSRDSPERMSTGVDNQVSFAIDKSSAEWRVTQFGLGGVN